MCCLGFVPLCTGRSTGRCNENSGKKAEPGPREASVKGRAQAWFKNGNCWRPCFAPLQRELLRTKGNVRDAVETLLSRVRSKARRVMVL